MIFSLFWVLMIMRLQMSTFGDGKVDKQTVQQHIDTKVLKRWNAIGQWYDENTNTIINVKTFVFKWFYQSSMWRSFSYLDSFNLWSCKFVVVFLNEQSTVGCWCLLFFKVFPGAVMAEWLACLSVTTVVQLHSPPGIDYLFQLRSLWNPIKMDTRQLSIFSGNCQGRDGASKNTVA